MTTIPAHMISDAADTVGGEFDPDYSGRGMYGKTCVGIVANSYDRDAIIDSIASSLFYDDPEGSEWDEDFDDLDEDTQNDYRIEVRDRMSSDNMGMQTIFYFRGVTA